MPISYREQLSKIGEPQAGRGVPAFPSGFFTAPRSLRAAMQAMENPRPAEWLNANEGKFENYDWSEECQGVATDGASWYLSSNNSDDQGIYRFSTDNHPQEELRTASAGCQHLGDVEVHDGVLYAAMEAPVRILRVPLPAFDSFTVHELVGADGGAPPQGASCSWCAVHPWNGLLYSSTFDNVTDVFAYRFDGERFVHVPEASIHLQGDVRSGFQGGSISDNGHLLVSTDSGIHVYSALNGAYLGTAGIGVDIGEFEEVEGITIWKRLTYNGVETCVHVILLDNDASKDDIYFKHYAVPDPDAL